MRDIGAARRGKAWHSEYGTARGPRSELLSHPPPPPTPRTTTRSSTCIWRHGHEMVQNGFVNLQTRIDGDLPSPMSNDSQHARLRRGKAAACAPPQNQGDY